MTDALKPDLETESDQSEHWIQSKWRPMMAFMYMVVCFFDFVIFPIGYTIVQFWEAHTGTTTFREWSPITLQSSGLFHLAMGAVIGVTAYGRTQEKIADITKG
jgi:hypothetical protein